MQPGDDPPPPPIDLVASAPLTVDAHCSVGVALAVAHLRGALVLAVADESRQIVGAVARETLERASRFATCGALMTVFDVAVLLRITVRPAPCTTGAPPAPAPADAHRPAA